MSTNVPNTIRFDLPADDDELVQQFYDYVDSEYKTVDISELLLHLPRKFRFAGYIGLLDYLWKQLNQTQKELAELKEKKKKKGWFY